ncbi:MAG: hypothetical protein IKD10_00290 [Lentisphaeria bacterium]|nr:hypothetical protein [Lentisphaerota bacterium]MBR7143352.1 hypothetical protein [Lentisphaeria bacterium]
MTAVWVKNLLNLQALDLEIRNLKLRLTMIPKEAEKLQQEIAAIEGKVKAAKEKKASHELQLKQTEAEIAEINDKIGKLQTQSALVKKNTEYQAMLGTIAMLKKSISELESKQIELMDILADDDKAIYAAVTAVKPETAPLRSELKELAELVNDIKARGRELLAKRPELRSMTDSEILPRYEQILKKNDSIPLVPVETDKCGNCHLRLTPQTLNQARSGAITFCDNCMHIIYMPDEQE